MLLCLLFCACSICLQAQTDDKSDDEYHPFIMDGTCEWFTALYGFQTTAISKEDTIIQNKTYKKIYLQRCDSKEKEYRGAIREENKQIFVVFETDKEGKENLLYDFNMKVGDRISYEYLGGLTFEVARIDKVEIEGIARRRYYFYDKNGMYPDQIYPYDSNVV